MSPFVRSFLLLCCSTPALLHGDVFHVAPQGSDVAGDGSNENPWQGITKALDECSPGDTVMLHKGVHRQRVEVNVSGSKTGGWITLMGEEGAVLSGKGLKGANLIRIDDQSHIRILNLTLQENSNPRESAAIAIEGSGNNIEIRRCRILNCTGKNAIGIAVYGTSETSALSDIIIDANEIGHCEPAPSEALAINGNVRRFQVTGNHIHDVNNIGIDLIGGERDIVNDPLKVARDGLCRGNKVQRARSSYGGGYAAGIYVDGGRNITVEANTVTECDLGIEIGAENPGVTASKIIVRNNTVFGNDKAGLAIGGYEEKSGRVSQCEIRGNIFYRNTLHKASQAELWIQHASGNVFEENIFWVAANGKMVASEAAGAENRIDRNTWHFEDGLEKVAFQWAGGDPARGFAAYRKASGMDASSKVSKPQFKDPAAGDFTQP